MTFDLMDDVEVLADEKNAKYGKGDVRV